MLLAMLSYVAIYRESSSLFATDMNHFTFLEGYMAANFARQCGHVPVLCIYILTWCEDSCVPNQGAHTAGGCSPDLLRVQVGNLNKALQQATSQQASVEKELGTNLAQTKEQLEALQRESAAQIAELEKRSADLSAQLAEASTAGIIAMIVARTHTDFLTCYISPVVRAICFLIASGPLFIEESLIGGVYLSHHAQRRG